jgi:hypothetical protein
MQAFRETSYMIGSWNPEYTWQNRPKTISAIIKNKKNDLNIK